MDILESLTEDHRLISGVLDALERFLDTSAAERDLDLVELGRFSVFLREFVELRHHAREEEILLPAMVALGYSNQGAPLVHVREEHQREATLLLELRRVAVCRRNLAALERARIVKAARDLISFERAHMKKESDLLYPRVKEELSGRTLEDLGRRAALQDASWTRMVEQSWLRSLAEELVRDHAPATEPGHRAESGL